LCFSRAYYGQSTGHDITPSNEREKIVTAYKLENTSIRKLAQGFDVSKAFVQRLLKQKKLQQIPGL